MRQKAIITLMPLLALAVLFLPGPAGAARTDTVSEPTDVTRVTIKVLGLACPFCTYNLEKRIKTLAGVPQEHDWQASVEDGLASFDWVPTVSFVAEAVREQIRKAGFTPDWMETVSAGAEGEPVTTRIPDPAQAQANQDGAGGNE